MSQWWGLSGERDVGKLLFSLVAATAKNKNLSLSVAAQNAHANGSRKLRVGSR